jgi:hypothetical protein
MSPKSNYNSGDSLSGSKNPASIAVTSPQQLVKTQVSFEEDLKNFTDGTVPQSLVIATVIGKSYLLGHNEHKMAFLS